MKRYLRSGRLGWLQVGALAPFLIAGCATSPGTPEAEVAPMPAPAIAELAMAAPAQAAVPGVDLDTVRAGRFDNGKMWTFEYPPLEYFQEAYGFVPDSVWFMRARLGALRLPNCTASFVSPHGLVMTNHHCGRGSGSRVSRPGENILDNGFYAPSLAEERRVEGLYVDQLIAIEDVTADVEARLAAMPTEEARAQATREINGEIQRRVTTKYGGSAAGIVVQVIALWNGARTSAYVFRRYSDMRLVMIPELQMGYYGGDSDNFTYPRYVLDVSFFRVYDENGQPLDTDNYFSWSKRGVAEGDAIFVIGNPGSTSRLETVAQLEFRRDVQDKYLLGLLSSRVRALQAFYDAQPEVGEAMDLRNTIFGLLNSEKLYKGRWAALNDPVILAKRRDAEWRFRMAIERDPMLNAQYGGLLYRMEQIQLAKLEYQKDYGGYLGLTSGALSSATVRRAVWAYRYLSRRDAGAPADELQGLEARLHAIGEQPRALQEALLTARLSDFVRHFGNIDMVAAILQGGTPAQTARAILDNSVLADSAGARDCIANATLTMDDPAVQMVGSVLNRYETFQRAFAALGQQEQDVARSLGRARFAVYGISIPPDATFSLRVADGVVKGYEYNGTTAPVFTTFYGLYDRYYAHGPNTEWDLPNRWVKPPATFDLSTPLNFVATADIIGGNSGSPVLNSDLEVVGLIFDGNIESLPGDYIYLPEKNRAVAVDVRGILEALDDVYDADRIVLELTAGQLAATESEADRVLMRR